ncbi:MULTISPECIES: DUF393 domain-containing protein [unclassified Bosea (in: a-proteobacteria)]|uniref:thiol-disulfide oxidoreductase DCC family protein n=1 Tax=unclassified Bosea (in: a-proteobacteria) TaxID=2653178 RepID=UPI000F74E1C3|nr:MULTISPECIES: DUF393 domain-containing protein [unclassified Bosea (in: a-proteobacteria)]AZO76315.1 hypothetical protein BLM15_00930 [Bosea sp. Tri-49]RXT26243.1 hypothetical protein B5U98_06840 [Bosea sp. Tri-39]RXT31485.1 hypothetical protein B5U99_22385 [Bosea sp. Tri-54]
MSNAFSDGNPVQELIVFLAVVMLGICFINLLRRSGAPDARSLMALASFLRRKRAFPEHDFTSDFAMVDLARIAVGLLATIRYGEIFISGWMVGSASTAALAGVMVLMALCVLFGFMTPLAVFLLMSTSNILVDNLLGASTLGTMVMSIVLLLLLLAPAGRRISADSLLVARHGLLARTVLLQWRITGDPSSDRLVIAKIAAIFAYYCVCIYSVTWHLQDEAWLSGMVIARVMLSPVSNPELNEQVWRLYQFSPWLVVSLSRISIYGMFAWYILVLPGLLMGKVVRAFVIWWGLAFFLISTFVLPLRFLGWYELVFWFVLFFPAQWLVGRKPLSLAILFDDRCNLCDRTVRFLALIDIFGQCEFRPIRRNTSFAAEHGVTLAEGLTDLVGIDLHSGRRYDGYELYLRLVRRLPLLWPALIPLELGRRLWIGPWLYRLVADRRIAMFGICTTSAIPDRFTAARQSVSTADQTRTWPVMISSLLVALAALSLAFLVRLPVAGSDDNPSFLSRLSRTVIGSAPLGFGVGKINVFNESDLRLFRTSISFQFTDRNHRIIDVPETLTSVESFTDREGYQLVAYLRAMSRANIGCDSKYLSRLGEIYSESTFARAVNFHAELAVISFILNPWPSNDDLLNYRSVSSVKKLLCRSVFELPTGNLVSLEFDQAGVNKALKRANLPRVFSASGMSLALSYPCRADAAWINTVVETDRRFVRNRALVAAALELIPERYGEFELACAARVYAVVEREPRLADPTVLRGNPASCTAGLALLREFQSIDAGLGSLKPEIDATLAAAEGAEAAGNWATCVAAAATGRARLWAAMLTTQSSTGSLSPLEMAQADLDEALKRADLPRVFSASGMSLASTYPCRADAAWINTVVETDQRFVTNQALVAAALDLIPERHGEFELACAARIYAVVEREPRLTDPAVLIGNPASCRAGLALLREFQSIDAGLGKLKPELDANLTAAEGAEAAGNWSICVAATATGRARLWAAMLTTHSK